VVGYAAGVGGARTLASGVFAPAALGTAALAAWAVLASGTFVALAVRRIESEERNNSNLKPYYTLHTLARRHSSAYDA